MKGPDPVDNAGERRIPRGGSLQESGFRVWPAAIDPQTPTVPGAKRPPGFSHHSGGTKEKRGESPPITTRPGTGWPPKGPEALRGEEVMGGIRRCWIPGDTTAVGDPPRH